MNKYQWIKGMLFPLLVLMIFTQTARSSSFIENQRRVLPLKRIGK